MGISRSRRVDLAVALVAICGASAGSACGGDVSKASSSAGLEAGTPDAAPLPSLPVHDAAHPDAGRPPSPPPRDAASADAARFPPPWWGRDAGGGLLGGGTPDPPMPTDASSPIDCTPDGGRPDAGFLANFFTVHTDIESFCEVFGCPHRTLPAFLDAHDCSRADGGFTGNTPRVTGCGVDTIGGIGMFGGTEYVYDSETGALFGARAGSDAQFGPCRAAGYVAGTVPAPGTCASETLYDCKQR